VRHPGPVFCFDLDDTLVSEQDYVESGLRAAGELVDAVAPAAESAGTWLVRSWRHERAPDVFQRLLRDRRLDAEWWLPRLKQAYRDHEPVLRPRAGVTSLLAALLRCGARLALVSDGYLSVQRRKWAALRLRFPFDPVIFTDEMGREHWKPHPWAFERVMRAHPASTRLFYVGDNPAKDFIAPNRLGWTTVLVRDERNLHPPAFREGAAAAPKLVIESLAELSRLARWAPAASDADDGGRPEVEDPFDAEENPPDQRAAGPANTALRQDNSWQTTSAPGGGAP
jgi:putative hydrolase of the HAD superfamily